MTTVRKSIIVLSIFSTINVFYSFYVSYVFTNSWKDFVETFIIMNSVFYLQLTLFPIGIWHERRRLLFKRTNDPIAKRAYTRSSLLLLAAVFTLITAGVFIAGFTTPRHYGPLLALLKISSVLIALFGLLISGLILPKELEEELN